jgi:hypothetical protein
VYEGERSEVEAQLEAFYRDIVRALDEFGRRKGATPLGFAVPLKRIALEHGIAHAEWIPQPRRTRAERESRADSEWQDAQ